MYVFCTHEWQSESQSQVVVLGQVWHLLTGIKLALGDRITQGVFLYQMWTASLTYRLEGGQVSMHVFALFWGTQIKIPSVNIGN